MDTKRKATCGVVVLVVLLIILLAILLILRQCESEEPVSTGTDVEEPTKTEEEIEEVVDMLDAVSATYDLGMDANMTDVLPLTRTKFLATSSQGVHLVEVPEIGESVAVTVTAQDLMGPLNTVGMHRDGTAWIVGGPAGLAATSDDGITWRDIDTGSESDYVDVYSWGDHIWLCGDGVRYSMNDGSDWQTLYDFGGGPHRYHAIHVTELYSGWAVGEEVISTTADGGFSGADEPLPGEIFRDMWVSDDGFTLYVVGEDGVGKKSSDGGQTWQSFDVPTEDDLLAVHVFGDDYCLAWSDTGDAYTTTDGGATWEERTYKGGPYDLNSVSMALLPSLEEDGPPDVAVYGPSNGGEIVIVRLTLEDMFPGTPRDEFGNLELPVDWD